MIGLYFIETDKLADSSIAMFNEIESLFIYLIQLAERNNVDIDRIINVTSAAGTSLFYESTVLSEKISRELIKRNVKVNKISNQFATPSLRVR